MDFDWLFPFLEAPEARHYDWNLHERFYAGQRTRVNNNKNSIKISFFISFTCFLGGKDTRTDQKLLLLLFLFLLLVGTIWRERLTGVFHPILPVY